MLFRGAFLGHAVAFAGQPFARQIWDIASQAIAPEGAGAGEACVDFPSKVEAIIRVGRIFDAGFKPVPDRERIVRAGKGLAKASGIAEGKVKSSEDAAASGVFGAEEIVDPAFGHLSVAQVDGRFGRALPCNANPDRVFLGRFAAVVAARPIDHQDRIEYHSPTSDRMNSAMAFVSLRLKSGWVTSSVQSLATALMVGSSLAMRGWFVSAR